jgi:hypothetical protein
MKVMKRKERIVFEFVTGPAALSIATGSKINFNVKKINI